MYAFLNDAVKKFILEDLERFVSYFQKSEEMPWDIRHKYAFKERPQKAIILQNVSASHEKLASDNRLAAKYSYVSKAQVSSKPGLFLEWVKEDPHTDPPVPGVYFLTLTEAADAFYVDPFQLVQNERVDTTSSQYTLTRTPLEGSLRVRVEGGDQLITGQALRLVAESSLRIGVNTLGLPQAQVGVSQDSVQGPYLITTGVNDVFNVEVNGVLVTGTLTQGLRTAQQLVWEIQPFFDAAGLYTQDYHLEAVSDSLVLRAARSLTLLPTDLNMTLGWSEGPVEVPVTGILFEGPEKGEVVDFEVDGFTYSIPFPEESYTKTQLVSYLSANLPLQVTLEDVGDYKVVGSSIELLDLSLVGELLLASYKTQLTSSGPFPIQKNQSQNTAIPGVVLAFGSDLHPEDKAVVIVESQRRAVADVYGGRFNVSVDLDVLARDTMSRDKMSSRLMMHYIQGQLETFGTMGILVQDVNLGGESEELYDEVGGEYYYRASISLALQTDWEWYVPRPLVIERVVPESFSQEAVRYASHEGPYDVSGGLTPTESLSEDLMRGVYFEGLTRNFDRIK